MYLQMYISRIWGYVCGGDEVSKIEGKYSKTTLKKTKNCFSRVIIA